MPVDARLAWGPWRGKLKCTECGAWCWHAEVRPGTEVRCLCGARFVFVMKDWYSRIEDPPDRRGIGKRTGKPEITDTIVEEFPYAKAAKYRSHDRFRFDDREADPSFENIVRLYEDLWE